MKILNRRLLFLVMIVIIIFSCAKKNQNKTNPVIDPNRFINISDLQNQLHLIAKNETPSVVFISTEKIVTQKYMNPFDFFFNDPFFDDSPKGGQKERQFKQSSLGSGVIYEKKKNYYYIVTNNHVVENVDTIEVTIDKTKIYKGEVIGADPQVDIAVVRIKTRDELQVAKFGDSDILQVGDFVAAIGNPFGLSGTMTFGIISALGRNNIQSERVSLTDFIQTDAAINPGNSGGPLINILGEVIGINTMIYSQSGGNVGIGFAVPVNVVKKTVDQIIKKGKVEHGFLGIYFKELTNDDINTLGLKDVNGGILVNSVIENSPADKYGIKTGDVIVELNGKKINGGNDFAIKIGNSAPGAAINLKVLRNNKYINLKVILGTRDDASLSKKEDDTTFVEKYGFELSEADSYSKKKYNIPENMKGVIVSKIQQNGRAFSSGIKEGDLIYKINNKEISSIKDLKKALDNNNEFNYFFIYRNTRTLIITM